MGYKLLTNGVFLEVINPLILTFDPSFQQDIQVQPLPSMRCVSIPHPLNLYGPRLAESLSQGFLVFGGWNATSPPPKKREIKAFNGGWLIDAGWSFPLKFVDGSEIRLISWGNGSLSHYLQGFSTIPGGWWSPDFWTINRSFGLISWGDGGIAYLSDVPADSKRKLISGIRDVDLGGFNPQHTCWWQPEIRLSKNHRKNGAKTL